MDESNAIASERIVVTGGAGFIGSALVRRLIRDGHQVLNIDNLTYAGSANALGNVSALPNYQFAKIDIAHVSSLARAVSSFDPDWVFHLAAESHVDRSIEDPEVFVRTNVLGTHNVLQCAHNQWCKMPASRRATFRVVHVSTDEVYGSLGINGEFTEDSQYAPNSPYAATKAGADHLARAWHKTYGLPVIITNCSNNYGPWQHPEKLIPTVIRSAAAGAPIPIYGGGNNVRDWLYVDDHVSGLVLAARKGVPGQKYNFGGGQEISNIDMARHLCEILDHVQARSDGLRHADAIKFVPDRPGHDLRYAINASKAKRDLGWMPDHTFEAGIVETVGWFVSNRDWLQRPQEELQRLGLART